MRRGLIEVVIGAPLVLTDSGWPEMVRLRDRARIEIAEGASDPLVDSAVPSRAWSHESRLLA